MTPVSPAETASGRLEDFDPRSGSRLERAVFNHRILVLLLFGVCVCGYTFLAARSRPGDINRYFWCSSRR